MSQASSTSKPPPKRILTEPLSPGILEENQMLPPGWAAQPQGQPAAGQSVDYWVTTNHGWNEGRDAGMWRLTVFPKSSSSVKIHVAYRVALLSGLEHRMDAEMICDDAPLCPLRSWTVESLTTDAMGGDRPDLVMRRSATLGKNGRWIETINGKPYPRDWPTSLYGDWSLMYAATQVADVANPPGDKPFTVIDNLTAIKPEQRWQALPEAYRFDASDHVKLSGFYQTGRGVLPREFWMDEAGGLAIVIDNNRLFIRDHQAASRYEQMLHSRRPQPKEGA